ncbi:hypothetical protein DFH28DRAFT_902835 [Melampsora americana]|nr:hypothetical protein DFH28DRAFT_902835 [Melampsora americana]
MCQEYLYENRRKYPQRYRDLVAVTAAHSDDEELPGTNTWVIKTLAYHSTNANKFFRRLDYEMKRDSIGTNMRVLWLPKVPSIFDDKPPKQLTFDFYDTKWHQALPAGRRRRIGKRDAVTLLPDASRSLMKVQHPDETLTESKFNAKYLDIIKDAYNFSDDESEEEEPMEDEDAIQVDLTGPAEDKESDFFSDAEYGDLYDDPIEEVADEDKGKEAVDATNGDNGEQA